MLERCADYTLPVITTLTSPLLEVMPLYILNMLSAFFVSIKVS